MIRYNRGSFCVIPTGRVEHCPPASPLMLGLSHTLHHYSPWRGLPHGYHTQKHWRKGRAVISYFKTVAGTLLRATSTALDIMFLQLLPQHPGQLSIPSLCHQLQRHFRNTPDDIHLTAINDDLVRFFNSVPQQRLVDAVISLCNICSLLQACEVAG